MVSCSETILTLLLSCFTRHVIEAVVLTTEQCFFFGFGGGGGGARKWQVK